MPTRPRSNPTVIEKFSFLLNLTREHFWLNRHDVTHDFDPTSPSPPPEYLDLRQYGSTIPEDNIQPPSGNQSSWSFVQWIELRMGVWRLHLANSPYKINIVEGTLRGWAWHQSTLWRGLCMTGTPEPLGQGGSCSLTLLGRESRGQQCPSSENLKNLALLIEIMYKK